MIAVAILLAAGSWATHRWLHRSLQDKYARDLTTVVRTGAASLKMWIDEHRWTVDVHSREPRTRALIQELVELTERPHITPEKLLSSTPLARLRDLLGPVCRDNDYVDFMVINPNGLTAGALLDAPVGLTKLPHLSDVFEQAMAGRVATSKPFRAEAELPNAHGVPTASLPTMLFAAPVYESEFADRPIAILGFRVRPDEEFSQTLSAARLGESGHAYAFDAAGWMLSSSRHTHQMQSIGLLPDTPGASSILSVQVRDPGGNLLHGHQPDASGPLPLTVMAASATRGQSGVDVTGYRDPRGVLVIGAWTWLPEYELGIASELDARDAYRPLVAVRRAYLLLLASLLCATGVWYRVSRKSRQWNDKLRFNEKLAQSIFDSALEAILICGPLGNILDANPAAEHLLGRRIDQLRQSPIFELLQATDTGWSVDRHLVQRHPQHAASTMSDRIDAIARRPDGTHKPVEYLVTSFSAPDRREFHFHIRELTPHGRTQKQIDQDQSRLEAVIKSAAEGIVLADAQGVVVQINPAAQRMLAISREEAIGRELAGLIFPQELRDQHRQDIAEMLQSSDHDRRTRNWQTLAQRSDTSRFPVELTLAVQDLACEPLITAYLNDVSKHRDELEQSQQRYRWLVKANSNWVWSIDTRGRLTECSDSVTQVLGYDPQDLLDDDYGRFMHEEDRKRLDMTIATQASAQRGWHGRINRWRHKDGTYRYLQSHAMPVYNPAGQCIGLRGLERDITQQHQAEENMRKYAEDLVDARNDMEAQAIELATKTEQLKQASATAVAANQYKTLFLANMSHEIRTPMTAILGYADLLLDPSLDDERRAEFTSAISRNGKHLLTLINDVLDLSKIEAGKLKVDAIPCSPKRLIDEVVAMLRPNAQQRGLPLDVEYTGPIPSTMVSDPTRLRQILVNLISNAIKFTKTGCVRVVVQMADHPHPDQTPVADDRRSALQMDVIDTGIGIAPEHQQQIFDPFTQAEGSVTRFFGGTGLGLTISKQLAIALGGDLQLESALGQGTRFTAWIAAGTPIDQPEPDAGQQPDDAARQDSPAPDDPAADVNLDAANVLLAEDGADNRNFLSYILTKAGATVTLTENGTEACQAVDQALKGQRPFDLIITDMQMPEMDGYAAVAEIRRKGYRGPIIALTAYAMTSDRANCLNVGCDEFATKPIDRLKFLRLAADTIDKHSEAMSMPSRNPSNPLPLPSSHGSASQPLYSEFADDPDMAELVDMFVSDLPQRIQQIEQALETADLDALTEVLTPA